MQAPRPTTPSRRHAERGFTLIEVMIVVVIIGVLAAIAIPSLFGTKNRVTADAEIGPMFAQIRLMQEQFATENGQYTSTTSGPSAELADMYPTATPLSTRVTWDMAAAAAAAWAVFKFAPQDSLYYCGYNVVAGSGTTAGQVGAVAAAAPFSFVAPQGNWYYIIAHCNMDSIADTAGATTQDSYYFTSSVDTAVQKLNPGK